MPRTPTLAEGPRDMTVKAVPAALYNALAGLAEAHHRPLRGEVLAALEQYVGAWERKHATSEVRPVVLRGAISVSCERGAHGNCDGRAILNGATVPCICGCGHPVDL